MAAITTIDSATVGNSSGQTYRGSFAIMTVLFVMWGFMTVTVFNDIMILRFKQAFESSYFQAMLVQFAFFGDCFIGSLLYFVISATTGDPIARIGYKNGVWCRPAHFGRRQPAGRESASGELKLIKLTKKS